MVFKKEKKIVGVNLISKFLIAAILIATSALGIMFILQRQDTTNHRVDLTIEQINDVLLPALEKNLNEIISKIDDLYNNDITVNAPLPKGRGI